jgi:hypothetical protein
LTYGTEQLLEEVSYVAYHFHWSLAEILDLEHPLRRAFAGQIERIRTHLPDQQPGHETARGDW